MQINIQARNFPLTDALRGHIERRLGFALSTRDDHIQCVIVRLSDINGPRRCGQMLPYPGGARPPV